MASTRTTSRTFGTAVRALALATVGLGIIYPTAVWAVGQVALPAQANGSLIQNADGDVVGSALLGQPFTDEDGMPLVEYFQPRPSAVGYDAGNSSGSNLGPENPDLIAAITEQLAAGASEPDALTSSSSGLDPHISVENATSQATAVAKARGLATTDVLALVESHTQPRDLGYLGEPTVNVLQLNLALDALSKNE